MNRILRFMPLGLLLVVGCHSDTKTGQSATTGRHPAAPDSAATAAVLADSPVASCRQYRGLLPGTPDSITLALLVGPAATMILR